MFLYKHHMIAGLLILLLIAILSIAESRKGTANASPKNRTIIAFGDSLVAGTGATLKGGFVPLLSKKINEPIINLGVSGDTTADGLERIATVLEKNPGVVLVLLGGNDFLLKVPKAETERNIREIIETLQKDKVSVILLGVRAGVVSDSYSVMYREIASDYKIPYVADVLNGLFGDNRYMSDGLHPNDKGYAIIAERIAPVLREVLE